MFTFLPRAGLNRDESIYLFYILVSVAWMLCSSAIYTQWKQLTNTLRCLFSFFQRWQIYSVAQWHGLYAHVAQLLLMLLITVVVVVVGAGAGAVAGAAVGLLWALCCKQSFNSTVQTMRMHCKFKSFYNMYENVSSHFASKRRERDREREKENFTKGPQRKSEHST